MRRLLFLTILLLLIAPMAMISQGTKITLTGHVTDSTHAVIQNTKVALTPGDFVTTTNSQGEFNIPGIPPGIYTVTVTSQGFATFTQRITIALGQPAILEVALKVNPNTERVEVSAETGHDMIQAIRQEIESPNIVNVMPEAQIIALPNANVADAIGRMPGVTVQRDEGEAVYIQVRGLDPRLSNVTIDGITIPAPEVSIRQVNLAVIPADMVGSIELNKTLSASQDADGIGGSVNLVTKKAGERPTLTVGAEIGETPIENTRYAGKVDTTMGMRFGASKKLGLIMGASYDYNGRGINDIEPQPDLNPDGTTTPYYDSVTLREYRYQRLRWGGTLGADYKMDEHNTFNAHVILSDFKDWGDKWYYELNDQDKPKYYESSRKPDLAIGSLALNGNHIYNNIWVKWSTSVSRSRELNSGGNPEDKFSPSHALKSFDSANCNYIGTNPKSIYLPMWSPVCSEPNPTAADNTFDLSNYTMSEHITTTGQSVQLNLQDWINIGKNYHVGKNNATLEFGGEFRNGHLFQNAYTPSYDYSGPDNASVFQSGFADPHYYSGNYHNGPFTDIYKINSYFANNPSYFSLDVNDTHNGSDSNNFDLIERVEAGYIMNTINWPKFRLQTGVRIEATQVNAQGFTVLDDSSGNWLSTTPSTTTQSYVEALPSVQARWQFTPSSAVRAVYARGISRPNPFDLVPYLLDNGEGSYPRYAVGNPKEVATTANNYDLLFEHEVKPLGLIQAGFFYKELINPIVSVYIPWTTINSSTGYPDIAQQNQNAANANVYGFEVSLRQRLSDEPGILHAIIMEGNYAYTVSNTNGITGRTDAPPLIGTARNAYNIQPSIEFKRFEGHLGISYNGANDNAYQYFNNQADPTENTLGPPNGPWGDNYFYPHLQVDAQVNGRIWRGLELKLDGLNLNNEVFGFYNGSPQYMTQREYYKPTYTAGLHWTSTREKK